jgi:hypothetical protein
MAKVLNELERGCKPLAPSFAPSPAALADRDRREALRDQQSLTAAFFRRPTTGERPRVRLGRDHAWTRTAPRATADALQRAWPHRGRRRRCGERYGVREPEKPKSS